MFDLNEVRRKHSMLLHQTVTAIDAEAGVAGANAEAYVRNFPRFKPNTGATQAATSHKVVRTRSGVILRIINKAKHAAALDEGARPHVIRGRPFLRFFWPKVGHWVTARQVRHPGNRPYRFLHGAAIAAGRSFYERMLSHMQRIARSF